MRKEEEKILSNEFLDELRRVRLEKNISLEDVAEKTNIKLDYVKAIEEGDLSRLPGGIYTKAYVKSISEFMGIDTKQFERVVSEEELFSPHKMSLEFGKESNNIVPTKTLVSICFLIIILVYLIFFSTDDKKTKYLKTQDKSNSEQIIPAPKSPFERDISELKKKNVNVVILALHPTKISLLDANGRNSLEKSLKINQTYIFDLVDAQFLKLQKTDDVEIYMNGFLVPDISKISMEDNYYILSSESLLNAIDFSGK
ncbi:MAG: helix-turn-helix domain-containing protein [Rickettsiales bacterium]|nr:helix-turn-helix domain-containing protein [Rickettsiales bacterium]